MSRMMSVVLKSPRTSKNEKSYRLEVRRALPGGGYKYVKSESVETDDKATAEKQRKELESLLNSPVPLNPTVLEVAESYMRFLKSNKASGGRVKNLRSAMKRLEKSSLAMAVDADLDSSPIYDWCREMTGGMRPLKKSTAKTYYVSVKAAWNWALKVRKIVKTSWPEVESKRLYEHAASAETDTDKRPLTNAEIVGFLSWCEAVENKWTPVFRLLIDTGARVNEIISLRQHDLTWREDSLKVRLKTQWDSFHGGWRVLKTPRKHPLTLPDAAGYKLLLPEPNAHGLLFPNARDPRRPADTGTILDNLEHGLGATGVEDLQVVDTHSLRRSWISEADAAGVSDLVSRLVVGHKVSKTHDKYKLNDPKLVDKIRRAILAVRELRDREASGDAH